MASHRIPGLLIFFSGISFVLMTTQIPIPPKNIEVGPRLFPYIGSIGMIICGLGMALQKQEKASGLSLNGKGWLRFARILAVFIAYAITLDFFGFAIATPVTMFVLMKVLAWGKKISYIRLVIIATVFSILLYLIFEKFFLIILPSGTSF